MSTPFPSSLTFTVSASELTSTRRSTFLFLSRLFPWMMPLLTASVVATRSLLNLISSRRSFSLICSRNFSTAMISLGSLGISRR